METLSSKIKKSGKDLSEHGSKFFTNTKTASKDFADFVQDEARDWGKYLKESLDTQRKEFLNVKNNRENIKARFDSVIAKITRREETAEKPQEETETEPETSEKS